MVDDQTQIEGLEDVDKTALGFGGKTINRQLEIGDELYLLMRCEISSDGRKEDKEGNLSYVAGARTTILVELTAGQATQIAAEHGKGGG